MSRARFIETTIVCLFLAACGGGGGGGGSPTPNPNPPNPPQDPDPTPPQLPDPSTAPALKTQFDGYFGIGAAIEPEQLDDAADRALLLKHYSNLTPENAMKADTIAPTDPSTSTDGEPYKFERADLIVDFAEANGMNVHGHALVWHTTTPKWFLNRPDGMSDSDYRATITQRLTDYITAVVGHFKGRVEAWDVVNEVAADNAQDVYRHSPWYDAFSVGGGDGREYIRIAFKAARAADPDALLFINDYGTEIPGKLANVLEIVDYVEASGEVTVNGVGHQFHLQRNADASAVDAALKTVADRGDLFNRVTELDVSIYADPASCFATQTGCQADYGMDFDDIPQSVVSEQAQLYRDLFEVFQDHIDTLQVVTTWGVHDAHTWLNTWPVSRTNRPLLFGRDRNPKLAFWAVADSAFEIPAAGVAELTQAWDPGAFRKP